MLQQPPHPVLNPVETLVRLAGQVGDLGLEVAKSFLDALKLIFIE